MDGWTDGSDELQEFVDVEEELAIQRDRPLLSPAATAILRRAVEHVIEGG